MGEPKEELRDFEEKTVQGILKGRWIACLSLFF